MAEPFELVDDDELFLYSLVLEMLNRQYRDIYDDAQLVFMDAYWTAEVARTVRDISPALTQFMVNGANISLADAELAYVESVPELFENVRFAAERHAGELIRGINGTTRNTVAELLQQSVTENWSLDQLTEALQGLPGSPFGEVRARLIAVSETTNSYIQGADFAAQELQNQGFLTTLIWQTVNDDRVCPICEPRNGQPQGSNWTDPKGAHPGCRCFVTTEVTKL